MALMHIGSVLELEIRRGFSSRLENYKTLKRWIEDAVGQIVIHDQSLYRHSTRIKEISSVLRKIDGKIHAEKQLLDSGLLKPSEAKWANARSFEDFESLIDDWVGCRIIAYVQDALPHLHKQINSHKRLTIQRVTIHDSHDHPNFSATKLRKSRRDERKLNYNGYVGIHYVVEPVTIDPCFELHPHIFHKFELQIRSLLQETWGQVQHEVIYKGRLPEAIKRERSDAFASLAGFLYQCDAELSRLSKDPKVKALSESASNDSEQAGDRYVRPSNGKQAARKITPRQRPLLLKRVRSDEYPRNS